MTTYSILCFGVVFSTSMTSLVQFTALTFGVVVLLVFLYVSSQAMLGHWLRFRVQRVVIGYELFNWHLFSMRGRHWEWRIGIIPLGGYTKFQDADEESFDEEVADNVDDDISEPEAATPRPFSYFQSASVRARISVALVGPLLQIVIAILLLAMPVVHKGKQLQLSPGESGHLKPTGVPGLRVDEQFATWEGRRRS
jgi:membrane-associated protease RseP (regulator of RpoE activity)